MMTEETEKRIAEALESIADDISSIEIYLSHFRYADYEESDLPDKISRIIARAISDGVAEAIDRTALDRRITAIEDIIEKLVEHNKAIAYSLQWFENSMYDIDDEGNEHTICYALEEIADYATFKKCKELCKKYPCDNMIKQRVYCGDIERK